VDFVVAARLYSLFIRIDVAHDTINPAQSLQNSGAIWCISLT